MKARNRTTQLVILAVIAVIGLFTIISNLSSGPVKYPQVGDKAPDFSLTGLDGKPYKLSDLKGKSVILNFWGTYCPPCKDEMPALQRAYDKWKAQGVEYVGANIGENAITVKGFMDQNKLTLPIWMDPEQTVRKQYGVSEYPTTFFISADGRIARKQVGGMTDAYIESALAELVKK
ncbi:redoxin domain-containing protein [Paenibacillus chartarius]|uniref:Redoxin domain-containing protein n=1 Tax=Paenibacillus chartarius TaxID=747481 RepID=A0ABV6DQM6_9BACL